MSGVLSERPMLINIKYPIELFFFFVYHKKEPVKVGGSNGEQIHCLLRIGLREV